MGKRALTTFFWRACAWRPSRRWRLRCRKARSAPRPTGSLHADLEAFRNSSYRQAGPGRVEEPRRRGEDAELRRPFLLQPAHDIRGVTIYGKGQDRNNAVAIFDGKFDMDKLLAHCAIEPAVPGDSLQGRHALSLAAGTEEGPQLSRSDHVRIHPQGTTGGDQHRLGGSEGGRGYAQGSGDRRFERDCSIRSPRERARCSSDRRHRCWRHRRPGPKAAMLKQAESLSLTAGESRRRSSSG